MLSDSGILKTAPIKEHCHSRAALCPQWFPLSLRTRHTFYAACPVFNWYYDSPRSSRSRSR